MTTEKKAAPKKSATKSDEKVKEVKTKKDAPAVKKTAVKKPEIKTSKEPAKKTEAKKEAAVKEKATSKTSAAETKKATLKAVQTGKDQTNKEQEALSRKTKAIKHHNKLPSYVDFDSKAYHWKGGVDYRKHPEQYKVGKGEQGVLLCQPYKGEILPHWKFATPEIAKKGSEAIYKLFEDYLKEDDFVGADMARKFLQMGFTRSRRYYNFKGGKKYSDKDYALLERGTGDLQKYESSNIYFKKWREAEAEPKYKAMKAQWRQDYG